LFAELPGQIVGLASEPHGVDHVRFTILLKRPDGVQVWCESNVGLVNDRRIGGAFINSGQRPANIDYGDHSAGKFVPELGAFECRFSVDPGGNVIRIRQR
jgi:hypothetical protein